MNVYHTAAKEHIKPWDLNLSFPKRLKQSQEISALLRELSTTEESIDYAWVAKAILNRATNTLTEELFSKTTDITDDGVLAGEDDGAPGDDSEVIAGADTDEPAAEVGDEETTGSGDTDHGSRPNKRQRTENGAVVNPMTGALDFPGSLPSRWKEIQRLSVTAIKNEQDLIDYFLFKQIAIQQVRQAAIDTCALFSSFRLVANVSSLMALKELLLNNYALLKWIPISWITLSINNSGCLANLVDSGSLVDFIFESDTSITSLVSWLTKLQTKQPQSFFIENSDEVESLLGLTSTSHTADSKKQSNRIARGKISDDIYAHVSEAPHQQVIAAADIKQLIGHRKKKKGYVIEVELISNGSFEWVRASELKRVAPDLLHKYASECGLTKYQ